jgi:hypothetical protein
MNVSRLIEFYLGEVPDSEGRTIHDILNFDLRELETVDNYIQWLFPVKERSQFNPNAPVLSDQDIAAFRRSEVLKRTLLDAFIKMLGFYGLELKDHKIVRSSAWDQRKRWVAPFNHNFLRISRILTSLKLLGLEEYAQAFYVALSDLYKEYTDRIGPDTWRFWTDAVCQGQPADH